MPRQPAKWYIEGTRTHSDGTRAPVKVACLTSEEAQAWIMAHVLTNGRTSFSGVITHRQKVTRRYNGGMSRNEAYHFHTR